MGQDEDAQQPAWLVERLREEESLRTSPLAERLRQEFFSTIQQLGETLSARIAGRSFWVEEDMNTQIEFQGYAVKIESSARWDTVAFAIGAACLPSAPHMWAWVYWLPSSGEPVSIADFYWRDVTDDAFAELQEKMLDLIAVFTAAVERGHP